MGLGEGSKIMSEIVKLENLQETFPAIAEKYLISRASDNPEFQREFVRTFSDLVYSQSDEMLKKLEKARPNSLLNAVFIATEIGASFAKKEISFIPYEIFKTETINGAEVKKSTGQMDATVIVDIKFQKQQILKLDNCQQFFTAEVHEGVQAIHDLTTGNMIFNGVNDVTKPTIGYYARFASKDGPVYDIFMTCAEIIDRAKFNKISFKSKNYETYGNNPHMEKVVVRNLMKIIPKVSNQLKSIVAIESYTEYEDVTESKPKVNALEEAKKAIAPKEESPAPQPEESKKVEPKNDVPEMAF